MLIPIGTIQTSFPGLKKDHKASCLIDAGSASLETKILEGAAGPLLMSERSFYVPGSGTLCDLTPRSPVNTLDISLCADAYASVAAKRYSHEMLKQYLFGEPGKAFMTQVLEHCLYLFFPACETLGLEAGERVRRWHEHYQITYNYFENYMLDYHEYVKKEPTHGDRMNLDGVREQLKSVIYNDISESLRMLSRVERDIAFTWLHENGVPLVYETVGITNYLFQKAIENKPVIKEEAAPSFLTGSNPPQPDNSLPPLTCNKHFAKILNGEGARASVERTIKENKKCYDNIQLWIKAGHPHEEIAKILKENGGGIAVIGALLSDDIPATKEGAKNKGERLLGKRK